MLEVIGYILGSLIIAWLTFYYLWLCIEVIREPVISPWDKWIFFPLSLGVGGLLVYCTAIFFFS